jgi:hypothetical protein
VRPLVPALLAAAATLTGAAPQPSSAVDAAFAKFWAAKNPGDAAKAAVEVVKTGSAFDEAFARLKRGRTFDTHPPVGIVSGRRGEFSYFLDVPATYDPSHSYQVRFQLHGGISAPRDHNERRGRAGIGRLAGAEQIYVLPASWNEEPWWSTDQVENLRAILDTVKRTYNVDDNRVVVSGVSDGGTGAYYVAMRDTTPYAAFLPLNGYILVLQHAVPDGEPDLFPGNLRNKPLFVVNGGRDPLYPMAAVEPTLEHLAKGGVNITYKPQPQAGHDTSWWPDVKDAFEGFVREHPRVPLPDRLTWETSDPHKSGRAHWLEIDALGTMSDEAKDLPDLNVYTRAPAAELGFRLAPGLKIDRIIKDTMAARMGLERNDVIQAVGATSIRSDADLLGALQTFKSGSPIRMTVLRSGHTVELSGTFEPQVVQAPSEPMFRRSGRSGRVDLLRSGNTVNARTRGVTQFTLLLSPDQFDFNQPVRVVVNGRTAFEGRVEKSLATLMKWAAPDNDRAMLFGAELTIKP